MEKLRLFTALPVPVDVRAMVDSSLRKGVEGLWTHPDDLHITLRFLGDVDACLLPEIIAALKRVRRPVFHVDIAGLGTFAGRRQTILWAGVQSTRKLTALAAKINEVLEPLGFEMPHKPYIPHMTLARLKNTQLKNTQGLARYRREQETAMRFNWEADSFRLFRSAASAGNQGRYSALECYPLIGSRKARDQDKRHRTI